MWIARQAEYGVELVNRDIAGSAPDGWTWKGAAEAAQKILKGVSQRHFKIVDDAVAEMSLDEKNFVDLPAKYKVDGRLMTAKEKVAVDAAELLKQAEEAAAMEAARLAIQKKWRDDQKALIYVSPASVRGLKNALVKHLGLEVAEFDAEISAEIELELLKMEDQEPV